MKKLLLIFALVSITIFAHADVFTLQRDNNEIIYWGYGISYWAVKYYVADSCTVNMIHWGRYTKRDEIDTLFVCENGVGGPGNVLYSAAVPVNTGSTNRILSDTVITEVLVSDTFWIMVYARTQNSPSSFLSYVLTDSVPDQYSYWSAAHAGPWTMDTDGNYFIRTTVTGPAWALMIHEEAVKPEMKYMDFSMGPDPAVFSSSTYFTLSFSERDFVSVKVYDKLGKIVNTLHDDYVQPGQYNFKWNGTDSYGNKVKSDSYFLVVNSMKQSLKKKVMLLR